MGKEWVGAFVRRLGLDGLVRFLCARHRVTIVVYHDPKPEILRRHLEYFARHYTFITLDAFERARQSGDWAALPRYPLVITLDDGHAGNARLTELFRAFNVRPTIFLCSQIVGTGRPFWWQTQAAVMLGTEDLKRVTDAERRERLQRAGCVLEADDGPHQALTWEEVAALAAVADFGAHSRHHPVLTQCDDARCAEETATCKTELEAVLGRPCRHFAYPNGDYGPREIEALRRAAYATGRTIEVGWNGPNTDPYRLKVLPVFDDASTNWLAAQMTGLPSVLRHALLTWRRRRRPASEQPPVPVRA